MNNPIMLIVGTRPEGIKLAPLYCALQQAKIPTLLCSTAQHKDLLQEVFDIFQIQPDIDLGIMQQGQDLFYITHAVLNNLKNVFSTIKPRIVIVQGDTTTSMAGALAAFYLRIPIIHVEAGLRTYDHHNPFPEEVNRRCISAMSTRHFAPTQQAMNNLLKEGYEPTTVFCTGNTVVDALRIIQEKIAQKELNINQTLQHHIQSAKNNNKRIALVTMHRRESFNGGIQEILQTIKNYAHNNDTIEFFYPHHPNPHIMQAIDDAHIDTTNTIHLYNPLPYHDLTYLLLASDIVLTDSGGIQEEAISVQKPVLVLREKTERIEGVQAGLAHLVGTHATTIQQTLHNVLNQKIKPQQANIYGDGFAAQSMVDIIKYMI